VENQEADKTSLVSREPVLESSELEEALAYIRQKKEGLLPGRIEGGCITSSALPEPTLDMTAVSWRRPLPTSGRRRKDSCQVGLKEAV
jgi:hypothetical protein